MGTIFIYILKWALCLAMLYIPFALLLRKERFASFNRWLLVGIMALSLLLPMVIVAFPVEIELAGNAITATSFEESAAVQPENTQAHANVKEPKERNRLLTMENLTLVYLLGVLAATALSIADIARIRKRIRNGAVWTENRKGMKIYCHKNNIEPFSWFSNVVISQHDYDECGKEILLHEEGHIKHRHSWDMLMLGLVKSLQWFNPFIYLLANDMKEIHEFEADRYVLRNNGDATAYQILLLKKAVGDTRFNLANKFSQSNVRKRIMMMANDNTSHLAGIKAAALVPAAALFLYIFAEPEYIYRTKELEQSIQEISVPELSKPLQTAAPLADIPVAMADIPLSRYESTGSKLLAERVEPADIQPIAARRRTETVKAYAGKRYYEYIDISGTPIERLFREEAISRCTVRMEFIADLYGTARNISGKGCSISFTKYDTSNVDAIIDNASAAATEAVIAHIGTIEWPLSSVDGEERSTLYDAHFILHRGETVASKENEQYIMAGSTPIK